MEMNHDLHISALAEAFEEVQKIKLTLLVLPCHFATDFEDFFIQEGKYGFYHVH